MNDQMIRVISSPSSSTTGFFTLIFAMGSPCCLEGRKLRTRLAGPLLHAMEGMRRPMLSRVGGRLLASVDCGCQSFQLACAPCATSTVRASARERHAVTMRPREGGLLEGVGVEQQGAAVAGDTPRLDLLPANTHAARPPRSHIDGVRFARVLALELGEQPGAVGREGERHEALQRASPRERA